MTNWMKKIFATLCALALLLSCAAAEGLNEGTELPAASEIEVEEIELTPEEAAALQETGSQADEPAEQPAEEKTEDGQPEEQAEEELPEEQPQAAEPAEDLQNEEQEEIIVSEIKMLSDEIVSLAEEQQEEISAEEAPAEGIIPAEELADDPEAEPAQEEIILNLKQDAPHQIKGKVSSNKPYTVKATDDFSRTVLFTLTVPTENSITVTLDDKALTLTKIDTEESIQYTFTCKLVKEEVTSFILIANEGTVPFTLTISKLEITEKEAEEGTTEEETIEVTEESEQTEESAEETSKTEEPVEEPEEKEETTNTEQPEETEEKTQEEPVEEPTEENIEQPEEEPVEEPAEELEEGLVEESEEQSEEEQADETEENREETDNSEEEPVEEAEEELANKDPEETEEETEEKPEETDGSEQGPVEETKAEPAEEKNEEPVEGLEESAEDAVNENPGEEPAETGLEEKKEFVLPDNCEVDFSISFDEENPTIGCVAHFKAELTGYEGIIYTLQWQKSLDCEEWEDEPNADQETMDVLMTEESSQYYWRLKVTVDINENT